MAGLRGLLCGRWRGMYFPFCVWDPNAGSLTSEPSLPRSPTGASGAVGGPARAWDEVRDVAADADPELPAPAPPGEAELHGVPPPTLSHLRGRSPRSGSSLVRACAVLLRDGVWDARGGCSSCLPARWPPAHPHPAPVLAPTLLTGSLPSPVVRGAIQNVTHDPARQESAIHLQVSRLYRQKSGVFLPAAEGGWRGRVSTLLQCGVRPGRGEFLFTGHMHFGEARLGCAPRLEDFRRMYRDAEQRGLNPCEMGVE